ncbi:hypothetical protein FA95DRAFT_1575144 [Auriscalpium vulgare]|uniref:Uncharacterized protein n=1 Tax=Auriscalpium vulgare TaxID=40419 RepID=A0ACB8RI52_9AGAM|nr:hypothetical protein FA95DRAFT_1575144 [Auriscalpium vulgare]
MDDSDDYFTDDLVLDEQTLAALDATESQFLTSTAAAPTTTAQHAHPRPPAAPPPAKRQKNDQGWTARPPPRITAPQINSNVNSHGLQPVQKKAGFSLDDMPDITIRGGFYGLPGHGHSQSDPSASQQSSVHPGLAGPAQLEAEVQPPHAEPHRAQPAPPPAHQPLPHRPRPPDSYPPRAAIPTSANTFRPGPSQTRRTLTRTMSQSQSQSQSVNVEKRRALQREPSFRASIAAAVRAEVSAIRGESPVPAPALPAVELPVQQQIRQSPMMGQSHAQLLRSTAVQKQGLRARSASIPISAPPQPPQPPPPAAQVQVQGPTLNVPESVRPSVPVQAVANREQAESSALVDEVASLRERLDALQRANEQTQAALAQAVREKQAKAGEAAILRHNFDKVAEEHRVEHARLLAAKNALEAAQADAQRQQQAELERLRTQLIFKQHEVETSVRKPPLSARRPAGYEHATPVAMRRWDEGPGPSTMPVSPLRIAQPPRSPPAQHRSRPGVPPPPPYRSAKKPAVLPGFVNAFTSSQPIGKNKPKEAERGKGKGKEREVPFFGRSQWEIDREDAGMPPPSPSPPSSPTRPRIWKPKPTDLDVPMADVSMEVDMSSGREMSGRAIEDAEVYEDVEPPDWVHRLKQIVFTHSLLPTRANTFQLLMAASFPSPCADADAYARACSSILGVLSISAPSLTNDFESTARTVCAALTHMAYLLQAHSLTAPLSALLNLLATLTVSLPYFVICLMTPTHDAVSKSKHIILSTIAHTVAKHLHPADPGEESGHHSDLAQELFHLLDILAWSIPPELESHSHVGPGNFRSLLAFPPGTLEDEDARDFRKLPQIENMCALLLDNERIGSEANAMREHLLVTLVQLALAHADGITILSESESLIPTLVVFLMHHSTVLWEEDPAIMSSPVHISEALDRVIRALAHALLLLHYLVFHTDAPLNLRLKLQHAPHRPFNGLGHMFVVAFGRLSYADAPEQVDKDGRVKLEQLSEPARDIMELVIEGPESESIWAAFQDASDPEDDGSEVIMLDDD